MFQLGTFPTQFLGAFRLVPNLGILQFTGDFV
jgi:hypothetical protein